MYGNNEQNGNKGCGDRVTALAPFVWWQETSTLNVQTTKGEAVSFSVWDIRPSEHIK